MSLSGTTVTFKEGNPSKASCSYTFKLAENNSRHFQVYQSMSVNEEKTTVTSNVCKDHFYFYIDNVKLYYRAPATVTFSSSVDATLPANITDIYSGTEVDLTNYYATKVASGYEFIGWSTSEGGDVIESIVVNDDTTLYAVYAETVTEIHPLYGQLAYHLDFTNSFTTDDKTLPYHKTTTTFAEAPAGFPDASTVKLVAYNTDQDPYTKDGAYVMCGGYPRVYLAAKDTAQPFPDGHYTIVWAAKADVTSETVGYYTNQVTLQGSDEESWPTNQAPNLFNTGNLTASFVEKTTFFDKYDTYVKNQNGTTLSNTIGSTMNDLGKIGLYMQIGNSAARTTLRYIDYMKIYYAPYKNVTVSFNANGKDVDVPETVTVSNIINPSNYTLDNCGTARFAGWATTPDGDLLNSSAVALTDDTTLYAVWDENFYPTDAEPDESKLLINLTFNNIEVGNLSSQAFNYTETKYYHYDGANSQTMSSVLPNFVCESDGKSRVFLSVAGDNNILHYDNTNRYNHPDNALRVARTATKGNNFPKIIVNTMSDAAFPDGVYTLAGEIMVEDNDKLTNVNIEAYAGTSEAVVGTIENINTNETYHVVYKLLLKDGVVYNYDTMVASDRVDNQFTRIGFHIPFSVSEDTTVYINLDNFRLYYEEYVPTPRSSFTNSIRVDAPAGIRFKASVANFERENESLSEYGFIVTRESLLTAAGIEDDDFTLDSEVTKVQGANYDKANGVDKVFEENGALTFFTAAVYNIPAANYGDNLVVRPYMVTGSTTTYGEPMTNNILAVATSIKNSDAYESLAEDYKEAIDKIIAGEEL